MNFFPQTPDEQVMYSTILIQTNHKNGMSGKATGFIYTYIFDNIQVPVLVTNKHVANSAVKSFQLKFHTGNYSKREISQEIIDITYDSPLILEHPTLDLAIIPFAPILDHAKNKMNKEIFYIGLRKENILQKEALENLTALEDIIMVGYPNGLYDEINYLPIFRTGRTASHPFFDFNGKGIALSDLSVFEGSSGSPIFLYNSGTYFNKKDNATIVGGRMALLGINSGVLTSEVIGQIRIDTVNPTALIPVHKEKINIGVYIKAYHLNDFELQIKQLVS
jgi:hypothetical protein